MQNDYKNRIESVAEDLEIEGLVGTDSEEIKYQYYSFPKFIKDFHEQVNEDIVNHKDAL